MKKVAALLVLALTAFALVACGGDDDGTTTTAETGGEASNGAAATEGGGGSEGGGSSTVQFETDPAGGLAYTTDEATAKAGKSTIELNNPQAVPHDVVIEDAGGEDVGETETITESSTSAAVDLKSGKYTFYCSVPGHREAGMEGTLNVN